MGFGYKGLFFCRNNGWLTENMRQGTHSTKMGADKSAKNIQNAQAQAQSPKIPMKKGFIGRP